MADANHRIARSFFAALSAGDVPAAMLTADFTAWTTTSGTQTDPARYRAGIAVLAGVADGGLRYTVDTLTAEADRVVAEVRAEARLVDGSDYANRYVFVLRIRDGRIASVAEHFDPRPVAERIAPLIRARMAG